MDTRQHRVVFILRTREPRAAEARVHRHFAAYVIRLDQSSRNQ